MIISLLALSGRIVLAELSVFCARSTLRIPSITSADRTREHIKPETVDLHNLDESIGDAFASISATGGFQRSGTESFIRSHYRPNSKLVTHPQARESNPDSERDFSAPQVR